MFLSPYNENFVAKIAAYITYHISTSPFMQKATVAFVKHGRVFP
jgi:hypothetical protein